MNSNSKVLTTVMTILIVATLWADALAERPWVFPPVTNEVATRRSMKIKEELIAIHDWEGAANAYLQLATDYPNTSTAASALFSAAACLSGYGNRAGRTHLLASIAEQFVGSRFEVLARYGLRNPRIRLPLEERNLERNDLLRHFGAPTIDGILNSEEQQELLSQIVEVHPDIRAGLVVVYEHAVSGYMANNMFTEALQLAQFGRLAITPVALRDPFSFRFRELLARGTSIPLTDIGALPSAPAITIISPLEGQSVLSGSTIEVQVTTGDYRFAQLDLGKIRFSIDGEEQYWKVIGESDLGPLVEGQNLETISLMLKPDLAIGVHTASVTLVASPTAGDGAEPARTTVTWRFTVTDAL